MPRSTSKIRQKKIIDLSALKEKAFDALFLSDIHFLISDQVLKNSHIELLELLESMASRKIRFRDVFLVGDIVENWYFSGQERAQKNPRQLNRLFDLLDRLWSQEGSLYFIAGNHDTTALNQGISLWLKDYLESRNWIVCDWYQNAHFIAIHGHQGQYGRLAWVLNILGVRILYFFGRAIPGLFSWAEKLYNGKLNHKNSPSTADQDKYYRKLSKIVHRRDRLLITGHTHEFLCIPEQKILNTGDWLESRTLVIQNRKLFTGYRLREKKLTVEYSLRLDGTSR